MFKRTCRACSPGAYQHQLGIWEPSWAHMPVQDWGFCLAIYLCSGNCCSLHQLGVNFVMGDRDVSTLCQGQSISIGLESLHVWNRRTDSVHCVVHDIAVDWSPWWGRWLTNTKQIKNQIMCNMQNMQNMSKWYIPFRYMQYRENMQNMWMWNVPFRYMHNM